MALRRYRHFWSSKLIGSAVDGAGSAATGAEFTDRGDLAGGDVDSDLTSIIKAYNPPEFAREVRQVETGKVMNERILGRLDPEATNFSITMPSDFEVFYGYNHDYQFEIEEELHDNDGSEIRLVEDVVEGTLFRREWSDFMHNGQDRDVTLHFILKKYSRTFMDQGGGNANKVIDIETGLGVTGSGSYRVRGVVGQGQMAETVNAEVVSAGETGLPSGVTRTQGAQIFGPNRPITP